ncbi:MAG: TIR domain-containing protein [Anaerolineales bacterium]|nr:TIR domain-containing protein [Anaerolineales bacterium]
MANAKQGSQGSVFISYSRKDKVFVQKLNDALDNAGVEAWVDWEGIELASDWMQRITHAIQTHDAFIFVVSPDSLKSKVCADELELGIKLNKKLIPVLYREPQKGQSMHEKLAATNWVYLRKTDDFEGTIPGLVQAIRTDLEWISRHTQLLNQALEWEAKSRNHSFLLQGTQLEDAEKWMADSSGKDNRQVLPLQAEFISASRKAADRRQRIVLTGISLALIISLVLSVLALIARNDAKRAQNVALTNEAIAVENQHAAATAKAEAETNQKIAEAKKKEAEEKTLIANASKSAAQAQIQQSRGGELDTSTLLAIESYRMLAGFQAENILRRNSSIMAIPIRQMHQDGPIWNINWTPDYEYFVTGNNHDPSDETAKKEACVYRQSDGGMQYCVSHNDDVNDALFTKDGTLLITASSDGVVKFSNSTDGKLVKEFTYSGGILDLDISDTFLAIAREDNYLTLYNLSRPDLKPVDVEQIDGVRTVKFSPNGENLAFGLQNGQVRFWQKKSNGFYNGPRHVQSSYAVLSWSSDNQWLVSGGGDSFARLTRRDGTAQHTILHQDWVEGVAFGPDPSWYATASDDNIVRVIDRATGKERFRMMHTHFVQRVIVSADGQWIASTGYDKVVRIWDSVSGTQLLEIPLEANGAAISFNQDHSRIVVTDEIGNIGIWDISALNSRLGYIEFSEFVREARFTPSGNFLVVNADDYNVWRIPADQPGGLNNDTDRKIILTAKSLTYNTATSPDSQWVAVVELDTENATKNRGTLVSINGETVHELEHGGKVTAVGFTSDSKLVATAGGVDGLIALWDVQDGTKEFHLDNQEGVNSMAFSTKGTFLAAGLHDSIKIWDWSTQKEIVSLNQPGDIVAIAISDDGKLMASGSSEGTIILWEIDGSTFKQKGQAMSIIGPARMLAFNPESTLLAGGGSQGFAYLWDVAKNQELARISHGSNPVTSVTFSIDGTQLFTVSRKVVRIWDVSRIHLVPNNELIQYACSHLISNLSPDDWNNYFADEEYRNTCPELTESK